MTVIRVRNPIRVRRAFHDWAFHCDGCGAWIGLYVGWPNPGEAADAGRRHWQRVHYVR